MLIKSHSQKLIFILTGLALLSVLLYLTPLGSLSPFVLKLRSQKLLVYLLVATATAIATISFQTVTENRFLTPSILGLEAFYVLLQTAYLFFASFLAKAASHPILEFLILLLLQSFFFFSIERSLKKLMSQQLVLVLLICLALGTLFRSASSFLQVLMDPNEYDKLQNKLFASFQQMNTDILILAGVLILLLLLFFIRKGAILDVFHLHRETAQILGVDVDREQKQLLWGIVLLTSITTALVGPMAFFGFLIANLAYLLVKDYHHHLLFLVAILIGFISLTAGQFVIERFFALGMKISMVIESIGGLLFFLLLYKRSRN